MTTGAIPHTTALVEYDPQWPAVFCAEAKIIQNAFSDYKSIIEHIGSTAVPGMTAKPTVDMMVSFAEDLSHQEINKILQNSGYEYYPDDTTGGRLFFTKDVDCLRYFNLSVVSYKGSFWCRQLMFRDALRNDPVLAEKYIALKQRLSCEFRKLGSYTAGKTEFIEDVLNTEQ